MIYKNIKIKIIAILLLLAVVLANYAFSKTSKENSKTTKKISKIEKLTKKKIKRRSSSKKKKSSKSSKSKAAKSTKDNLKVPSLKKLKISKPEKKDLKGPKVSSLSEDKKIETPSKKIVPDPTPPKKKLKRTKKKNVKKFALNFKDVDISEFLNIMGQIVGKNIILDDKVRGKISILSAKEVPLDQAYNIMKTILEVKGLAVVETQNLINIVPIKDAIKKNVEIIVDGERKIVPLEETKTVTTMLEIKNTEAKDILSAIKSLKSRDVDIVLYEPLNMLIFSGSASDISGLIAIAKELDKETPQDEELDLENYNGNIHIVRLQNSDAEKMANVLSRIPFSETAKIDTSPTPKSTFRRSSKSKRVTRSYSKPSSSKTKLSIIASKETNSLIITATPEEFKQIKRIIKQLDTVREQVLIEVLILEVGLNTDWGFGIDWMLGEKASGYTFGGSSLAGTAKGETSQMFGKDVAIPLAQGLQLGILNDSSLLGFILLNATASEEKFNILSTPQILTIDNEEAEINVGEEIPVQSNTRITENNTSFNTWDYKSVGIKLKITPHITLGTQITLDIYQEVNSVLGAETESLKPPRLGKRDLKTKITVNDGKTIVVGGLITNSKKSSETKVPILGDIPLLGWFFKRKGVTYTKNNLLIFITPRIVTTEEKIDAVTREKRDLQRRMKKD